jgi:broad specificity phosphatase PhoE
MSSAWTGQSGAPTRLLLLRHGQTVLSIDRRYSGHGDPELTTVGRAQAAGAAARLASYREITSVLTSPLRRARQTAEAVAQTTGATLEVRDGLIETDFGEWEGLTFSEARDRDPELHAKWLGAEDVAPPRGESFAAVRERVRAELASIVEAYEGETIVLVTHVTPIKMILRQALGGSAEILYRIHLDLACLSEVHVFPDGGMCVRLVNDTSHRTA